MQDILGKDRCLQLIAAKYESVELGPVHMRRDISVGRDISDPEISLSPMHLLDQMHDRSHKTGISQLQR